MNPYAAAHRGARLLDRELPRWARIVKPDELEMDVCDRCVLGQLFRDFDSGYTWLKTVVPFLFRPVEAWYGFDIGYAHLRDEDAYYDDLERAWKEEIAERASSQSQTTESKSDA